ncbi:MAG TPA: hypothetical protein ENG29_01015 [Firmicutes bacterium]|uniref:PHA accumulation regulator DNA-binding N-terminal domain-containing protein n=1 Tax=Candidatus Coatesbacteria bacterium 4484_99 TaxID=1970774 RepID=A0A1W9S2R4_9BACT|nr:MAG: hypothetical protein B6D57_02575 [Candidatus Coatesbacteria bacterium 4484_99]RLC42477.1 MAG: hypothetical protein DRH51_00695 [Candidatus Coatesbacteria bacterium]RLC43635.1 MAG: hypothetical protein DRH49_00650 [Candidatus Coatesbacteria bacterium]RLC43857.1 MAG: hypothetical protein DRH44_04135 [Candidatus Coatesbacteria bacterium]HDM42951.1 hypothetical protein [Bacillota bacterium]
MKNEEAVVVKKYSNRRLYDTERGEWINLSDLARVIRDGRTIRVLEHETGDDITVITLIQVMLNEIRDKKVMLSATYLLHRILKDGDRAIEGAIERSLIGSSEILGILPDDAEKIINIFVEEGKISPELAKETIGEYRKRYSRLRSEIRGEIEGMVREYIDEIGIPSKDAIGEIIAQIEELKDKFNREKSRGNVKE